LNLYFPNGASSPERHKFKIEFLEKILGYFQALEKKHGGLIVCGDFNIAHKEIDIHDPVSNKSSSGFLPEERAWMDRLVEAGFIDTFRHVHGDKKDQYSWWSFRQRSRERNKGWRLDYFFVSKGLAKNIESAEIHPKINGSDHCPVSLEIRA
jgi:exodeoxyribonuclease-3